MTIDYDQWAYNFEITRGKTVPIELINAIIKIKPLSSSSTVLDIGCGTGRVAIPLHDITAAKVTGIDVSKKMLNIAKSKANNIEWILDDANHLKFHRCCFDLILLIFVLHHLQNYKALLHTLKSMLTNDGTIIILTVTHNHIKTWPKTMCLDQFSRFIEIDLARFPNTTELIQFLQTEGYMVKIHTLKIITKYHKDEYIAMVKNKYLSTFSFISEKEFSEGYKKFLQCIEAKGEYIKNNNEFLLLELKRN